MKETTVSIKKHVLKYGVIVGLISISYMVIRYVTNNTLTRNWILSIIELSIYIGVTIFGIYRYKILANGFLRLGQGLKIGMGIIFISTCIQILWDILFFKLIAPDILDKLIGLPKDITTVKHYRFGRKFDFLFTVSLGKLIANVVLGFVVSLISAVIMQKKQVYKK
ncbi:DUF4199 domain-containing protein [Aquimarina sp. AU474]|uniref:DUF4199 domain-containing protein n=1 Tax=Aquimarina sp. AU474 TaxID=2108529 RepID=UPI000D6974D5|nr:DUF4199 domain-containing protein [Aquimarina sp. AU474]